LTVKLAGGKSTSRERDAKLPKKSNATKEKGKFFVSEEKRLKKKRTEERTWGKTLNQKYILGTKLSEDRVKIAGKSTNKQAKKKKNKSCSRAMRSRRLEKKKARGPNTPQRNLGKKKFSKLRNPKGSLAKGDWDADKRRTRKGGETNCN